MKILLDKNLNKFWISILSSEGIIFSNSQKHDDNFDLIISENFQEIDLYFEKNKKALLMPIDKIIFFSRKYGFNLKYVELPFFYENFSYIENENIDKNLAKVNYVFAEYKNLKLYGYKKNISTLWSISEPHSQKILINSDLNIFAEEKLSKIVKKNLRSYIKEIFLDCSQFLNKPIVSIWKFPYTYQSIFNLRLDVDPDRNTNKKKALSIIKDTFSTCSKFLDRTTFAINFYNRYPDYNFFNKMIDTTKADIQSHAFFHCLMPSRKFNESNMKMAKNILSNNNIYVKGFVVPEYFWYNNVSNILENEGYLYSNSLGFDHSNYPYKPVINNKIFNYFELPVDPVTLNRVLKSSPEKNLEQISKIYLDYINEKSNILGEPFLIYGHPGIEGKYTSILEKILLIPDRFKDILPITSTRWVEWLKDRNTLLSNISINLRSDLKKIEYKVTNKNLASSKKFSICLQYKKNEVFLYNIDKYQDTISLNDFNKKFNLIEPVNQKIGQTFYRSPSKPVYKTFKHIKRLISYLYLYYEYKITKKNP